MSNWINDDIFNDNFRLNHPNDYSLVCQNNTIYYSGDTKVISGMISVNANSTIDLGKYRITSLNPNQWKMEPYQLFFFIKETVTLLDTDKVIYHNKLRASLLINNELNENNKFELDFLVDYYNALRTIESYLSGDLYDTYNTIKKMLLTSASKNQAMLTKAEEYIYNRIYDIFQKDNPTQNSNDNSNSESESRGISKTLSKLPAGAHFGDPSNTSQDFNNLAFVSVCILVVLILAIVVGSLTYLLS